ncbi:MAG: hypothetical protein ABEJ08_04715 [Halobacteriaceae archaeon]
MPTCPHCDAERETGELDRHVHDGVVIVRCPACNGTLGRYSEHGEP